MGISYSLYPTIGVNEELERTFAGTNPRNDCVCGFFFFFFWGGVGGGGLLVQKKSTNKEKRNRVLSFQPLL